MSRWMRTTVSIALVVAVFIFSLVRDNLTMFFTIFVPMTIVVILIERWKAGSLPRLDESSTGTGVDGSLNNEAGMERPQSEDR